MVSALSVVALAPLQASAGAWVPEPGSGYHKLAVNYFRSTEFFGEDSIVDEFTNTNLSYYGEVGVLPRLALYGTLSLTRLEQHTSEFGMKSNSEYFGLGDVDLGLRYELVRDPFVLSAAFLFKLPYFYDDDREHPPGNGQEDVEFRLLLGKSLGRWG